MAATTVIHVFHDGGSGTEYSLGTTNAKVDTVGHIRYKQADDSLKNTANPIPIPTSGSKFSYLKHTKLKITGGSYTDISNLRWYTDGLTVQPAGQDPNTTTETVIVWSASINASGGGGQAANGYLPAVASHGDSLMLTAPNGYSNISDAALRTAASPLTLTLGTVASSSATGYGVQPFLVTQMEVMSTASSGSTSDRSSFYRYDEV